MSALLIAYDLNRPRQRYAELYEAIESLGPCWHRLDSTWIVVTALNPNQVMSRLESYLDDNDNMIVIDISGDPRQGWLSKSDWEWIDRYV